MVEQDLFLNMIGFSLRKTKVSVSFYKKEQQDFKNLQFSQLPFELTNSIKKDSQKKVESLYTDFQSHKNADYTIAIDLKRNKRFAVWYYRYQLKKVVAESDYLQKIGFVSDLDLWKKASNNKPDETTHYQVFSLRVQIGRMSQEPELVFMYKGISRVLNTSLLENEDFDDSEFVKFVYQNRIYTSYNDLPETARRNEAAVFPVVNKSMERIIPALKFHPSENKYPKIKRLLDEFKEEFLNLNLFQEVFLVADSSWLKAPKKAIHSIHLTANNILLGEGGIQPVISPKKSLFQYGPVKLPEKAVRFFLIFIEGDNKYATQLYMNFRGLKKNARNNGKPFEVDPGKKKLDDYIRIAFKIEKEKAIILSRNYSIEELDQKLKELSFDRENYEYMGVFISPISKAEQEKDEYEFYYHLKELLLQKHIHSQVIYKEHIFKEIFEKYFMVNIASAILAKLGGIPWDIPVHSKNELIIGVGAFKSKKFETQYIGSAISYIPGQGLQKFDCVSKTETQHLAVQIRLMLQKMIEEERDVQQIVIHFYKNMSNKELQPIKQVLFELGYRHIPIYIVSVNKTSNTDYLAFNGLNTDLMPYSGTIIEIGHLEYLLFNNTLYPNETNYKAESWNLPVKLKIQSTHTENLKDIQLVKHLIDQVYQFSRLYYKSVKQQNLPVTITYPEMMARIYPHFKNKSLGSFAKAYPWFL